MAVLALAVAAGCRSWVDQHYATSAGRTDGREQGKAASAAARDELESILAAGDAWCESIRGGAGVAAANAGARWRNRSLEDLLARPHLDRAALRRALASEDKITAANAAIALARLGSGGSAEQLAEAVRCERLKLPLRLAAAESLASLSSPSAVSALGRLLDQYGDFRLDHKQRYVPQLHAELLLGLSRHALPENDQRFIAAADSPSAEVRLVVAGIWAAAAGPHGRLPTAVADLTDDSDPRVRGRALTAVARAVFPQAKDRLQGGMRDGNIHVRVAAVEAIGQWHNPAAKQILLPLLQDRSSIIRAAAVASLWAQGEEDSVLAAAGDESWRVRAAVARSLRKRCGSRAQGVARRLLDDSSLEVQEQLVNALGDWPLQACGELLLAAMGSESPRTRKLAAARLAERWPPAARFPYTAAKSRREEALALLRGEFMQQHATLEDQFLQQASYQPDLTIAPLADDTAFELIDAIEKSGDCSLSRRAAEKLASLAAEKPLSTAAVAGLAAAVAGSEDQLIWQYALNAVASDGSPSAAALACAAIGHDAPEVRRRACEHLAAHANVDYADVLLTAINDPHLSVAKAAVAALGRAGRKRDAGPLKRLLLGANASLRLEAAVALLRLGDGEAAAELRRLSMYDDPQIRHDVAREMGRSGQRQFTADLIRMLDDRAGVRRQALESLETLHRGDSPLAAQQQRNTTAQRVELWKRWYAKRHVVTKP